MKKIFKTAALVTIMSCVERFIGFLYRIYLSRQAGAEALGLYQIALSVVGVIITMTASGIPVTVSRLMIKEKSAGRTGANAVTAGIITALIISVPACAAFYFLQPILQNIFADVRCYDVLSVILPGVVLTSVYACIRGFFWGNRYYGLYSTIELIEEIAMCVAGVILTLGVTSPSVAAVNAGKAVLISYIVSFLLSTFAFIRKGGKLSNPKSYIRPLLSSSFPVTLTRTLSSMLGSVVAVVIPARLAAIGCSPAEITKNFGELSGMAMPLLFIPSTVIGSLALVSLPEISESYYTLNTAKLKKGVTVAFDCSLFVTALIIPVFFGAGAEICKFLYANDNAGKYLMLSAGIMLPMSVSMICCSVLNSLGKEKLTLLNFTVGAVSMLAAVFFLTPLIGVYSLIAGYAVNFLFSATLDLIATEKSVFYSDKKKPFNKKTQPLDKKQSLGKKLILFKRLLKTVFAIILSSVFTFLVKNLFVKFCSLFLTLLFTGILSVIFTFVFLFVLSGNDVIEAFPSLKKIPLAGKIFSAERHSKIFNEKNTENKRNKKIFS